MQKAINNQIKNEFDNAYLYLSFSTWFKENDLLGFSNWNFVQFKEEETHAFKFLNYIMDRQGKVELEQIEKPANQWKDSVEIYKLILTREEETTKAIYDLYKLAQDENDYTSLGFLKWYLDEQVEEENNATEILNKLEMLGDSRSGLILLDSELAQRKFTDETK